MEGSEGVGGVEATVGGSKAAGVVMGSADPHGTGVVDSVARRTERVPATAAHVAASDEELLGRPFAKVNIAPTTDPIPPPQVVLGPSPPPVTSVDQVVPRATLVVVRRWMRKLRRCLKIKRRSFSGERPARPSFTGPL